jgi:molybdopterin-guanine dinucleotide biosynthesis protein A
MIPVSAVILAGGQSRRMGLNKALLEVGDRTIIERAIEKVALVSKEILLHCPTHIRARALSEASIPA